MIRRGRRSVCCFGAWLVVTLIVVVQPTTGQVGANPAGPCSNDELTVHESEHFTLAAVGQVHNAVKLLELAEDVYDDFTFLVGEPSTSCLFGDRRADIYILADRDTYEVVIHEVLPSYRTEQGSAIPKDAIEFYRLSERVIHTEPPVAVCVSGGTVVRNWVVSAAAHFVLAQYLGRFKRFPPWLAEGFAAWMEVRHIGTSRQFRVTTGAYGDGEIEAVAAKIGSADRWSAILDSLIRADRHRGFDRLKHLTLNHLAYHDLVQSWSLVTFLVEERPKRFVRWLRTMRWLTRIDKAGWEHAFFHAYGWTGAAVDERWSQWVRLKEAVRCREARGRKKWRR